MNTNTGVIKPEEHMSIDEFKESVRVSEDEMTDKQKKTKQVSLHDNRSILGKKRVDWKKQKSKRKTQKKSRRNSK